MKTHTMLITLLLTSSLILLVNCNVARAPRFIRGTYTSTVFDTSVVTSLIPSSCVHVDATLPPCRNVRYLRFPFFTANGFNLQDVKSDNSRSKIDSGNATSIMGWGEYLGFYAPTVTVTETMLRTTVAQDPRVVVTFAVKGCRPLKIPSDLDRCSEMVSSVPIQEILPTSTVGVSEITPTASFETSTNQKIPRLITLSSRKSSVDNEKRISEDVDQHLHPYIASSTDHSSIDGVDTNIPTEPLPN